MLLAHLDGLRRRVRPPPGGNKQQPPQAEGAAELRAAFAHASGVMARLFPDQPDRALRCRRRRRELTASHGRRRVAPRGVLFSSSCWRPDALMVVAVLPRVHAGCPPTRRMWRRTCWATWRRRARCGRSCSSPPASTGERVACVGGRRQQGHQEDVPHSRSARPECAAALEEEERPGHALQHVVLGGDVAVGGALQVAQVRRGLVRVRRHGARAAAHQGGARRVPALLQPQAGGAGPVHRVRRVAPL